MKRAAAIVLIAELCLALTASAKTFEWRITSPQAHAETFTAYHGETVRFNPVWSGALSNVTSSVLYYQTNGMDRTWWQADGLTFAPSNDVGAASYRFFIRATDPEGVNYTANGLLRLMESPGFVPNTITPPVAALDFDSIDVWNAPYYTKDETDAKIVELAPAPGNYSVVSNKAMNAVQKEWYTGSGDGYTMELGDGGLFVRYVDEGEVLSTGEFWPNRIALEGDGKLGMSASDNIGFWVGDDPMGSQQSTTVYENGAIAVWDASGSLHEITIPTNQSQGTFALTSDIPGNYATVSNKAANAVQTSELSSLETDPTVPSWAKAANKPSYTASEVGAATSSDLATIAGMLNAENARFVSTNYNSASHIPSAYVEAKIDGSWLTIWSEMTRWNWLMSEYLPDTFHTKSQIASLLDDKADRAWGFYDSHSGLYAPEGFTWVSSPKIAIAGGLAYSRTLTAEGAIWVLEANGMVAETGGLTNGFFRVSDDEGNALFEIVKGDKRTVGAQANSVQVIGAFVPSKLQIGYAVVADTHPTLQITASLSDPDWYDEDSASCPANVTWSGVSGAYVATVQAKSASATQLFVKAEYQVGGETYIKNVGPISVDGGIYCTDGIHRVRPVYNNGNITWEVVQ